MMRLLVQKPWNLVSSSIGILFVAANQKAKTGIAVGGAIALIVLAASVWGVAKSTEAQGNATRTSVDNLPAMPAWP